MKKRLFVLSVLSSLAALAFVASGALATHDHPTGASPLRVPLVPAFKACDPSSANSTHGAPLNFQSCNPPDLVSTTVRTGPGSIGFALINVCNLAAGGICNESPPGFTSAMKPDVRLRGNGRDVQCRITGTPSLCVAGQDYNPNSTPGPYTTGCIGGSNCNNGAQFMSPFCAPNGSTSAAACIAATDITATASLAQATNTTVDPTAACSGLPPTQQPACILDKSKFLGHAIRVTDHYNCDPGAPVGDPNHCPAQASTSTRPATLVDLQFPVPADCLSNPEGSTTAGSTCGVNTTANALVPGSVIAGKQAVVETGEVQDLDSGPDGARGNSDDQVFAVQGIYLP